jgi:hypothetical protein
MSEKLMDDLMLPFWDTLSEEGVTYRRFAVVRTFIESLERTSKRISFKGSLARLRVIHIAKAMMEANYNNSEALDWLEETVRLYLRRSVAQLRKRKLEHCIDRLRYFNSGKAVPFNPKQKSLRSQLYRSLKAMEKQEILREKMLEGEDAFGEVSNSTDGSKEKLGQLGITVAAAAVLVDLGLEVKALKLGNRAELARSISDGFHTRDAGDIGARSFAKRMSEMDEKVLQEAESVLELMQSALARKIKKAKKKNG